MLIIGIYLVLTSVHSNSNTEMYVCSVLCAVMYFIFSCFYIRSFPFLMSLLFVLSMISLKQLCINTQLWNVLYKQM